MGYGSAAEEERMLSYSPKEMTPNPTSTNNTNSVPTTLNTANPPSSSDNNPQTPQAEGIFSSFTTSRISSYARQTWQERRPWAEFYSTRAISRPQFAALSDRFATNLHIYRANYQIIAAFWLCIVMLGTIHTLLLAAVLFWVLEKWYTRAAGPNGSTLQQKHTAIAVIATLIIIWITGIGKYMVWSLTVTGISVALHAAFHEPECVETEIV